MPTRFLVAATRLLALGAILVAVGTPVDIAQAKPGKHVRHHAPKAEIKREEFARFVEGLWPDARKAGISRETFDAALKGVAPDPKIVELTRKQAEFSRPIWEYVNGAVSPQRLAKGQAAAEQWRSALDGVESRYGVPREIVLAVWGMESGFGANTGGFYVVRALATLALIKYRGDFFRGELIDALRILQAGHVDRERMKGSWAGAMGQTQFMPSSYASFAVDADGDGHPDIWSSAPDALASTANFLRQKGWRPGEPWVVEVALPGALDLSVHRRPFGEWASLGVQRVDGQALSGRGDATLFLPAGVRGPAFLVGSNFETIRAYNTSDAYALGVGYLANRIAGGPALSRPWPKGEVVLSHREREEVQERLAKLGLYQGEADGRHGARTRESIRAYQVRAKLTPDGYADMAVLKSLRGGK